MTQTTPQVKFQLNFVKEHGKNLNKKNKETNNIILPIKKKTSIKPAYNNITSMTKIPLPKNNFIKEHKLLFCSKKVQSIASKKQVEWNLPFLIKIDSN